MKKALVIFFIFLTLVVSGCSEKGIYEINKELEKNYTMLVDNKFDSKEFVYAGSGAFQDMDDELTFGAIKYVKDISDSQELVPRVMNMWIISHNGLKPNRTLIYEGFSGAEGNFEITYVIDFDSVYFINVISNAGTFLYGPFEK